MRSKSLLPRPAVGFTALFAFLGFADAAYLTAEHYLGLPLPCSTDACETVLTSPYATIGPIPLALFGAVYYLVALCLAVYVYTAEDPDAGRRAAIKVWALSGLGLLASAYFVYLQLGVLQAVCLYCMGSALSTFLLFISSSVLAYQKSHPQQG